jgi:hypothetical protein
LKETSTPFPLLRTYFSTARRISRFIFLNILNLTGLVLGIIGFSSQNVIFETVSVASLAVGIIGIIVDYIKWRRDVGDLNVHSLATPSLRDMGRLTISPRLVESHYQILTRRDKPSDSLLTSDEVNEALFRGADPELRESGGSFRNTHASAVGHVLLRQFTEKKAVLFNAAKVRMVSDPVLSEQGGLRPVQVGKTHYYETLVTNDAMPVELVSHSTRNVVFSGRDFCFPKGTVPACGQSACSNQVGASTLAVTSDGFLVIAEQGRRSAIARGQLGASGSGSADWTDKGAHTNLQKFVKHFARRELLEECGLSVGDVDWIRIIGYGRLLDRGGLPQFFCLAKLNCDFAKVRITRPERALTDYQYAIDVYGNGSSHYAGLQAAVKGLLKEKHKIFSSLWWTLELVARMPEDGVEDAFACKP